MSDVDVLLRKALQDGDRRAFDALHAETFSAVLRMANSFVHSGDEAEDIVQAAFLILHKRGGRIRDARAFWAWMWRTIRFLAMRLQRDKQRRAKAEMTVPETPTTSDRAALGELLNKLGASDRQVLVLRFFRGLSVEEVGEALHISTSAAQMRIGRALDRAKRKGGPGLFAVLLGLASASNSNAVVPPSPLSGNVSLVTHQLAASHSTVAVFMSGLGSATVPVIAGSGALIGTVAVGIWLSHRPPAVDVVRLDAWEKAISGRYRGTMVARDAGANDFRTGALVVIRRMKNPDRLELRMQEGDRPVESMEIYPVLGKNEIWVDGEAHPAKLRPEGFTITFYKQLQTIPASGQLITEEVSGVSEMSWSGDRFRYTNRRTGKRFSMFSDLQLKRDSN